MTSKKLFFEKIKYTKVPIFYQENNKSAKNWNYAYNLKIDKTLTRFLRNMDSFRHLSAQTRSAGSVADPDSFLSISDPDPTLMSTTKRTGTENVTTYACFLAPCGPNEKESN